MMRFLWINLLVLFSLPLMAQDDFCTQECAVDQIIISTGYNQVTGTTYPVGSFEPIWTVVETPIAGISVPRPAYVVSPNSAWGSLPGSAWISPFQSSSFSTNNPAPNPPYAFENCFCVCQATELTIDITALADDEVDLFLVDDDGNTIVNIGNQDNFLSGTETNFVVNVGLEEGSYCLRAELRNLGAVAMGLNLSGTITGPGLVSTLCCQNTGTITGVKYHDRDCDGERDAANFINSPNHDPGLPNWEIVLCDDGNNPVATTFTDQFGFYTFNDVPPGNYTVKEINQSGWVPGNPASGMHSITVDTLGVVANLDFGNCEMPCGGIVQDSFDLDCSALDAYVYYFQVENLSGYDATSMVINDLPPGYTFSKQFWSDNIDPELPILDGNTSGWIEVTIFPPAPITQPTEICFDVVLLSGDYTCCHFEHCITLLPLDPCEDVSVMAFPRDTDEACCYDIAFENNFCPDFFIALEAEILTPGIVFSQYNTGSDGTVLGNADETAIRYTPNGGTIDLGLHDLSFCLDGIVNINQVPQEVVFNWYATNDAGEIYVACTDTLEFFCEACLIVNEEVVDCNPDGTVNYTFTVINNTLPAQTSTQVLLEVHNPGVTFNPPLFNVTLNSGDAVNLTTLITGASPGDVINFKVTLLDEDGWCCHLDGLSITVPDCGGGNGCECGDYEQFFQEVQQGFVLDDSECPLIQLIPAVEDECNQVEFTIFTPNGQQTVTQDANGQYTFEINSNGGYGVCMEVIRFNDAGEQCFPNEEPAVYCEDVVIECLILVDSGDDELPDIEIYPNPVAEVLQVKLARHGTHHIQIVDGNGQVQLQYKRKGDQDLRMQVNQLPDGIYWLIATDAEGNQYQKRFVKM